METEIRNNNFGPPAPGIRFLIPAPSILEPPYQASYPEPMLNLVMHVQHLDQRHLRIKDLKIVMDGSKQ